jgi:hypothetical protein
MYIIIIKLLYLKAFGVFNFYISQLKKISFFPLRQPTSLWLRRARDMGVVPGPPEAAVTKQSLEVRVPARPQGPELSGPGAAALLHHTACAQSRHPGHPDVFGARVLGAAQPQRHPWLPRRLPVAGSRQRSRQVQVHGEVVAQRQTVAIARQYEVFGVRGRDDQLGAWKRQCQRYQRHGKCLLDCNTCYEFSYHSHVLKFFFIFTFDIFI